MPYTTKLSSKGQVVLPKPVRTAHGWKPGTEFLIVEQDGSILLRPKSAVKSGSWDKLLGFLPYTGRPKTIPEMDEAVLAEARKHK